MTTICIKISEKTALALRKLAAKKQLKNGKYCSVSSLIREGIEEFIVKEEMNK